MKSDIFSTNRHEGIAARVKTFMNAQEAFMSQSTISSPRATGDAIHEILGAHFQEIVGEDCAEYSASFARRSMADLAFRDEKGFYYIVDIKTHREGTKFNMPNLTSVERLVRFYEDDANYFVILLIRYRVEATRIVISDVHFIPIEFISWDSLTIGALGWGQIQIANSNRVQINPQNSRKRWMLDFFDIMLEFYPKEIGKITSRMEFFEKARGRWECRPE